MSHFRTRSMAFSPTLFRCVLASLTETMSVGLSGGRSVGWFFFISEFHYKPIDKTSQSLMGTINTAHHQTTIASSSTATTKLDALLFLLELLGTYFTVPVFKMESNFIIDDGNLMDNDGSDIRSVVSRK